MGAFSDANFDKILPATEATVLNVANDNEKKKGLYKKIKHS